MTGGGGGGGRLEANATMMKVCEVCKKGSFISRIYIYTCSAEKFSLRSRNTESIPSRNNTK